VDFLSQFLTTFHKFINSNSLCIFPCNRVNLGFSKNFSSYIVAIHSSDVRYGLTLPEIVFGSFFQIRASINAYVCSLFILYLLPLVIKPNFYSVVVFVMYQ